MRFRANVDHVGEHGGARVETRRQARRDRACAVERLGAEEPRRADANARAGYARRSRQSRRCARKTSRADRDRRGGPGLFHTFPKNMRRRLGPPLARHRSPSAEVLYPAMPPRAGPELDLLERARAFARRHLGQFAGVHGVSRHRVDAGAVPLRVRNAGRRIPAAPAARLLL